MGASNDCFVKALFASCCLVVLVVGGLLIAYGARLGTGDESHTLAMQGTCRNGTADVSTLKVMTFNTFLIPCLPGVRCQEDDEREARIREATAWFDGRDEDVVLFQEVWSFHDVLRDGMADAGFCHYVTTEETIGSGLAIFSKHPIEVQDYEDWYDAFGIGGGMAPNPTNLEAFLSDKGVLYARILKDGNPVHVFNLHANSDTKGDFHGTRMKQFEKVRDFVDSMEIPPDEPVLIGGDFNEDVYCRANRCEAEAKCEGTAYYDEMLEILSAQSVDSVGDNTFTYDTETNGLLKSLFEGDDCDFYRYRLDYIFYSENHLVPSSSSTCEVLNPKGSDGTDLSDHHPVTCTLGGIV